MSDKKILDIPDIREVIYTSSGRLGATRNLIEQLKKFDNLESKLIHNKLTSDYLKYISNRKYKKQIRRIMNILHEMAIKLLPEHSITTKAREKAFLSYFHKLLIALYKGESLDKIKDTRACRIIIDSDRSSQEELIKALGTLVNNTISYLIDNGFQLCEAPPPKDTKKFNSKEHPEVYIPLYSYIKEEYKIYVKDYVATPKENGYQSYHIIAIDPEGNPFEIQFRTYDMDVFAECKMADHNIYKELQIQKYNLPVLDRSRVHWSNYRYEVFTIIDTNGNTQEKVLLADDAGLEKSISICTLVYNP